MRDALPDLMHGTLPAQRQAAVRAHVDGCDACRAELALLARIRHAVAAPAIGRDRIVASLPPYRRQTAWQRVLGSAAVRIAAAVVLLAGGTVVVSRNAARAPGGATPDSITGRVTTAELALGETFADVSDSALVALVDALDDLDATFSEEPEPAMVSITPAEGL
jgi:predicted anti-sigma-YlaC factor YlaD